MNSIRKATADDRVILSSIGKQTFIESHGHSAAQKDIDEYVDQTYTESVFINELSDPKNIYHIIFHQQQPAGFSKIVLNDPHKDVASQNVTKLERIYLLKEFYGLNLGNELMNFNIELSRQHTQSGMWLYVWKENHRAIAFYLKSGFKIIGDGDFRLTATHSNPNHLMLLSY
jgi:ribosomal protein S18 acetylase RimI-like enzyme